MKCWLSLDQVLKLLRTGELKCDTTNATPVEMHINHIDIITARQVNTAWQNLVGLERLIGVKR